MSLICGSAALTSLSHERPIQGARQYFREVGGDCSVASVGKFRNGSPKAWCRTHARVVRPAVDNTCPDMGSTLKLRCLSLDVDRYVGGVGIWGSLPPAIDTAAGDVDEESLLGGVHVHARLDLKSRKDVDDTYDVVALYRSSELVLTLDTASSTAFVQARIAGIESSLIRCPRCGAEHIDEDWFAVTPHRKHQCMCCGREFYDKVAGSGNTVEARVMELFPHSREPRVCPNRKIDLTRHLDAGRYIRIWGTHEAIVWTAVPELAVDLFGYSQASGDQLLSAAREFACSGDVMALDAVATGSGVLVVREPQRVTVLTDLAGVWPVFYATVGETLLYSSSASAVAGYVGGEVDERWLAARLLAGGIPAAWSQGSGYRRVAAVPAGGMLLIDRGGRPAVVRRELPLGTSSFTEGAQRLGEALSSAVGARMAAHGEVSADLSGGLDSSVVAALAGTARPQPALRAITLVCAELGSDDPVHARRVAAATAGIRHIELSLPGEVDPYAALTEMPSTDEPFEDVSIFARLRWWMRAVQELGARVHLTGDGGDAVLVAPPAYLVDLARHARSSEPWLGRWPLSRRSHCARCGGTASNGWLAGWFTPPLSQRTQRRSTPCSLRSTG